MNLGRVYIVDLYPQAGHKLFNVVLFRNCLSNSERTKSLLASDRVIVCTYNVRRHYLYILILYVLKIGNVVLVNHNNVELALTRWVDKYIMLSLDYLGIVTWNFSPRMTDVLNGWGFKHSYTKSLELTVNTDGYKKSVKCFFYKPCGELESYFEKKGMVTITRQSYVTDSELYRLLKCSEFVYLSYSQDYVRFSGMAMFAIVCGCSLLVSSEQDYHSLRELYADKVYLFNAGDISK